MRDSLVVDDDPVNARLVQFWLSDAGYQVTTVGTPRAALRMLRTRRFAVIVVDLLVPELDGLALCREMRRLTAAPIIMLSASHDPQHQLKARAAGADAYLTKPFDQETLRAQLVLMGDQGLAG